MMGNLPRLLSLTMLLVFLTSFCSSAYADVDVLIVRPEGKNFNDIVAGLDEELDGELSYRELIIGSTATSDQIYSVIRDDSAKVLVVMGNQPLRLIKKVKKNHPDESLPPVVAVAALFIDMVLANEKDVTGILYEVPAVTGLVNLRNISKGKIQRVGVLYRESMSAIIESNRIYCEAEGIELIGLKISNKEAKNSKKTRKVLKKLKRKSLDALWITNDSLLLTKESVVNAWIPFMSTFKKPVLVGVKSLINSRLNMGTFAVFPDHSSLGVQTAGMLFDLMDNDWKIDEHRFDHPISVKKYLNTSVSEKRGIKFNKDRLRQIDKLVE